MKIKHFKINKKKNPDFESAEDCGHKYGKRHGLFNKTAIEGVSSILGR
jgi:hypothetical protein